MSQHSDHEPREANPGALAGDRRDIMKVTALGLIGGLAAGSGVAKSQETASASRIAAESFASEHEPVPLPFNASSLSGLSERLIESHWANNYGGSVRALNEIKRRIAAALGEDDIPTYVYNDLKREHLMRTGSVVLHELYFGNLGGNGRPDADVRSLIASAFNAFDRWEREFRRVAAGLGGGSGWAILGYNRHFGTLENYWLADHLHGPSTTEPLLVIDMYEHSYPMDYGAAAARYVDAFFANINWEVVLERFEAIA